MFILERLDMDKLWIEEQEEFEVGDSAFLISFFNESTASTRYVLRNTPAYTNRSNEPKLHGWCGTYNNIGTYGEGAWQVVRIAKSGRYLIKELTRSELILFLEDMGYPELIPHEEQ